MNAKIDSVPPFPGKERHLLRAQLARIQHATQIVPKGLFEMDEETNLMKYAEDFTVPGTKDLASLEAWGHLHQTILKAGRCTHVEPVGMDEEAKEEYMGKLNEADKTEERFRAIVEDSPLGENPSWISKISGDS